MISERCERQPETANTKDFPMTDEPEPKDAKKDAKEPRPIIHLGIMVVRKWVKEFGADPKQAFPGHRSDEARAAGDRPAPAGGRKAQGGARHPKKGRGLLGEGVDMKFGFIAKPVPFGFAKRLAYRGLASMPG